MTEQAATYELTTINDIFNKVPLDRIETCMKELTLLLIQAKAIEITIKTGAENSGIDVGDNMIFKLPETHSWIDDNKGEISMDIACNGDKLGNITTNLNSESQPEKSVFYGIGDREILYATTEQDAVVEWFEGLSADDVKNLPETVEIAKYMPRKVDTNLNCADLLTDTVLEELDEEYGSPDGDSTDFAISEKAIELRQAFINQVCNEFPVWQCEVVGTIEVNPMDFLDAEEVVEFD